MSGYPANQEGGLRLQRGMGGLVSFQRRHIQDTKTIVRGCIAEWKGWCQQRQGAPCYHQMVGGPGAAAQWRLEGETDAGRTSKRRSTEWMTGILGGGGR